MRSKTTAILVVAALAVVGCATKSDIDSLRAELLLIRAEQDSLTDRLAEVERAVTGSVADQRSAMLDVRGNIDRRLDDIERQLVQIQELLGQSQAVLRRLRERADERPNDTGVRSGSDTATAGPTTPTGGARAGGGDDAARALYSAAVEQFNRGAFTTARTGLEEFLVEHPDHELAPRAQYWLAETYREAGELDQAVREYTRVVELYPNAEAAPEALLKAGIVQIERGNKDSGCQYFQRVLSGYPRSDSARLARQQSERLSCR